MKADVENLKGWQRTQNGHIRDVSKKLDKLIFWMMTASAGFVLAALAVALKI